MFRKLALVLSSALLVIGGSPPSGLRAQATQPADVFAPLSFLAGSCWQGPFSDRPSVTDEHCFEWVYEGKFLRDTHVVRGDAAPYEGQTLYAWNPQDRRIVYWYIARPGFYSTGYMEPGDGRLVFVDDLRQSKGKRDLRSVWTRTGPDTVSVRTEEHTGGAVKELWSMEWRRVRKP